MYRVVAHIVSAATGDATRRGLSARFEDVVANLSALPRLFIEPDGSFVWRGESADGQLWQLEGNLIDRGEVLDYVELKGTCPSERVDDVLRALGWPEQALVFQLPRKGLLLSEAEFRRQAATPAGAG